MQAKIIDGKRDSWVALRWVCLLQGRATTSLLTKTCIWWPLPAQHLLCSPNFVSSTHPWVPLHNHPFEYPQHSIGRTTDCVTKVSPYTEIRKLEFLCEDIGDMLLCMRGMCALTPLAPEHGVCLQVDEQAADTWSSLPCSTNPDWKSYPHRPIFLSFTFLFAHCFYRSDEVLCPWKWYSAYIWLQTCKEELTPSASWDFIPLEVDILSQPSGFITCFLSTSLALTICSPECIHPNIRVFGRKFVFCLFKIFFYTIILYRGSWNATIKSVAIYTRGAKKIWLVFSFSYWYMLSITILI